MSNEPRKERRSKKRKKRSPLKIFFITLLILFLASGGVFAYYMNSLGNKLNDKSKTEAKKVEKGEPINFLLLGVDAGDYDGTDKHKRSDTMMLIRYIPKTDKVYILSIPRDTKVKIKGKTQKINAAHAIGGPELTIKTIEDLLDVDINYYGSIDYEGFRACVDAVGGVEVVVPENMNYKASDITIKFNKGETVQLDGKKAEQFVRWRKNNDTSGYATGDLGRVETQQVFMVNFLQKLKSAEGITKLPSLLNTVTDYAETNMNMSAIMSYAKEIVDVDTSTIEKELLAGESFYDKVDKTWYYLYDEVKAQEFLGYFRDKGITSADNKNTPLNNENMNISIYNATTTSGLASQYKERLEKLGFKVTKVDTNKTKKDKSEVIYSGEEYNVSGFKNYLTGVKYTKNASGSSNEIKLILGTDAINGGILIGSPTSSDELNKQSETKDKSSKKIKILNSTSKSGLAARYKEKLERQGYKIVEVGNHNVEVHETQIIYKNDNNFANEVSRSLGTGTATLSKDASADVVIILGTDLID